MVKRGYRVVSAPSTGLANMHLPTAASEAATDSEILGIGYLGVEVKYTMTEKQKDTETGTRTKSLDQSVHFVPTQAFQQICTEYSHLSSSSSTVWETPPKLSTMCYSPVRDNTKDSIHVKSMPVLSPLLTRCSVPSSKLGSTGSDLSTDCESYDTAWSEMLEDASCLGVSNRNISAAVKYVWSAIDIDTSELFDEAVETPFTSVDIETLGSKSAKTQVVNTSFVSDDVNQGNRNRMLRVRTMNDLNNEKYCVRTRNTDSLNSIPGNIFENDIKQQENYHENNESNMLYQNDFANEIAVENLVNSNIICRNEANSIDMILDMQKYVIQKENIYNENHNNKKWHVKCSECKTMKILRLICPQHLGHIMCLVIH